MEKVPVSSIDFNDHTYFTGHKGSIGEIIDSIREIGLINPPVLIRNDNNKYSVITGWKRLLACRGLGYKEIECKVYGPGGLTEERCLKLIFEDNRKRLDDLETSEILFKFKELMSLDDEDIIKRVMPVLGLVPSRKHLDRYLALFALEPPIKEACYTGKITVEQALSLTGLGQADRLWAVNGLILKYRLNINETKQLISDTEEIALRDKKPISELIRELERTPEPAQGRMDKNLLRRRVKALRYPSLSRAEYAYSEALEGISLPPGVDIARHPYFETNEIEIRIKAGDQKGLSDALDSLTKALGNGRIDKLIRIVKYGGSQDPCK